MPYCATWMDALPGLQSPHKVARSAGKGGRPVFHLVTVKLVFFADLHLDAPFAWLGGSQLAARRRRQALRETLRNITRLA